MRRGDLMVSRRALMTGALGLAGGVGGLAALAPEGEPVREARPALRPEERSASARIDDLAPGTPISPYVYGAGETGNWDGAGQSVAYDLRARPTIRRLGGNMMSTYNWRNNAAHAGNDWRHANGAFLLAALDIPEKDWGQPAAVIETFLDHSRAVGVPSLVALPLSAYVAADFAGEVDAKDAAPSRRFSPVDWSWPDRAIKGAVNIPALVALLKRRHGGAGQGGVRGYYLDNEPGLWPSTHPRVSPSPVSIKSLSERSLRAAIAIKSIDPDAWVLGPASWGATEFTDFVKAADWPAYRGHGSFLGAYLDAFRLESERRGLRLLDHMDVHWYPAADIYRSDRPESSQAILDAPRSLDDPGYCEKTWVADVLGCGPQGSAEGVALPILPSLRRVVESHFPGTGVAIGEYNYGGAALVATGLAIADALGRFGRCGVSVATHWGSLAGFIGEGFRLFRMKDSAGEAFGEVSLPVAVSGAPELSAFAARAGRGALQLIVLNKSAQDMRLSLSLASGRAAGPVDALGFDAQNPCAALPESALVLPPFSARRFRLA